MSAFIFSFILILAAPSAGHEGGGFGAWWHTSVDPYINYPGFELWKFLNLGIFVAIMVYLLKRPLSETFKAKREAIRAELIRAEEERQAALAQLTSTEARLAALDSESAQILEKARLEAEAERARILAQTEEEVNRLRRQTESETARLAQQSRAELRRFSAEESIRLAEEKIKQKINSQADAQLVRANIQTIGGLNR
ncbi:MAG TPA: ATP synthase F0 subunit B [Pyrinomonadaceae bacterium]|jgi:F0F1-type ATP synthase membrane subunit b/b'